MDPGPAGRLTAGFTTIQFVVATALSLVFFVLAANFIVFQYGRGAVRAAVDEGVRAGSLDARSDAERVTACSRRAEEVLGDLLRGPMGNGVHVECGLASEEGRVVVTARARAVFGSWLPPVPDWGFQVTARTRAEEVRP